MEEKTRVTRARRSQRRIGLGPRCGEATSASQPEQEQQELITGLTGASGFALHSKIRRRGKSLDCKATAAGYWISKL